MKDYWWLLVVINSISVISSLLIWFNNGVKKYKERKTLKNVLKHNLNIWWAFIFDIELNVDKTTGEIFRITNEFCEKYYFTRCTLDEVIKMLKKAEKVGLIERRNHFDEDIHLQTRWVKNLKVLI